MNQFIKKMPSSPGVYLMKNKRGEIIYVGKAGNLKKRVASYFSKANDYRIQKLVSEIKKIDFEKTDTALEALILESALIKTYNPVFNIRDKDNKSFLYVEITNEIFPRVLLVRERSEVSGERFGPFVSASDIREALKILRKIFPYSIHEKEKIGKLERSCFDYQIGLCPGTCIGTISCADYMENIKNLKLIFKGQKKKILKNLKREMKIASENMEFEKAGKFKTQIFALQHIQDTALISSNNSFGGNYEKKLRIEGYDISNISGTSAAGSMVVFIGNFPVKKEYKLFKIRTFKSANDTGMLKEVLKRRLSHKEWPMPDLFLIDGGKGQVNVASGVLEEFGLKLPVVGIAKGQKRKKNEFIGKTYGFDEKVLIKVRNEAHRFAINYHKKLRGKNLFS